MAFLYSYTKYYPGLEFDDNMITIYYKKVLLILSWRYVDMKKMSFPKLEVIQFNTEDVIVTSSTSTVHGLDSGIPYFALGSEVKDAYPEEEIRNSDDWFYKFKYDASTDQYYFNQNPFRLKTIDEYAGYYAWYNKGWKTENQYYTSYSNGYTH